MKIPIHVIYFIWNGRYETLSAWTEFEDANRELDRLRNLGYPVECRTTALNESFEPYIPK